MSANHPERPSHDGSCSHQALIYATDEEFLGVVVPFVEAGLAADEAVLVATTPTNQGLLRDSLGEPARDVEFVESRDWYRNPTGTLRAYDRYLAARAAPGSPRARIVGEPFWPAQSAAAIAEWQRYESILNVAFAHHRASVLCPYDGRALPEPIVEGARMTHPEVWDGAEERVSDLYAEPAHFSRRLDEAELVPPPSGASVHAIASTAELRELVRRDALRAGLDDERVTDVELAVTELASNTIRHASGTGTLTTWTEDGALVCEIGDEGPGLDSPFAGYLPPDLGAPGGLGVWLVRRLADEAQIRSSEDGTVVRVRFAATTNHLGRRRSA